VMPALKNRIFAGSSRQIHRRSAMNPERRFFRQGNAIFAALIMAGALLATIISGNHRSNPVVEGRPMSDWALALVCDRYGAGEYSLKQEYMRVFRVDRERAVFWLMSAVNYQHSKPRLAWNRVVRKLPDPLAKNLRPTFPNPANRWAGVLALSNLSREKADPLIAPFFLKCMSHPSPQVRKIAAYESGPWLDPEHPLIAIEILRLALSDKSSEVRRDACRRIVASVKEPWSIYAEGVRGLLPVLEALDSNQTPEAARALAALKNS